MSNDIVSNYPKLILNYGRETRYPTYLRSRVSEQQDFSLIHVKSHQNVSY